MEADVEDGSEHLKPVPELVLEGALLDPAHVDHPPLLHLHQGAGAGAGAGGGAGAGAAVWSRRSAGASAVPELVWGDCDSSDRSHAPAPSDGNFHRG